MSGASAAERGAVEPLNDDDERQHHERGDATAPHRGPERHRLQPDAGEQVIGQHGPIGRGRGSLPRRLLLQEDGREGRRIPVLVVGSHGHQWSDQ